MILRSGCFMATLFLQLLGDLELIYANIMIVIVKCCLFDDLRRNQ